MHSATSRQTLDGDMGGKFFDSRMISKCNLYRCDSVRSLLACYNLQPKKISNRSYVVANKSTSRSKEDLDP